MKAGDIHIQAEKAREEGDFLDALKLYDEAIVSFAAENDNSKFAEVLCSRALTLRHLFEESGNKNYAKLAKFEAKAAIKILEMNDEKWSLGLAYYTLAKCLETLGKFEKAKEAIIEALRYEDDKGAITEMNTRLSAIEYMLGDEAAFARFNTSYDELINSELDSYVKDVWSSGARLHMARAMIEKGENTRAQEQLDSAREIIEANSELKLRAGQLSKLQKQIN